jgi:hypothetical protein
MRCAFALAVVFVAAVLGAGVPRGIGQIEIEGDDEDEFAHKDIPGHGDVSSLSFWKANQVAIIWTFLIASLIAVVLYLNRSPGHGGGGDGGAHDDGPGGGGGGGGGGRSEELLRERWANRFVEPQAEVPEESSQPLKKNETSEKKKNAKEAGEKRNAASAETKKAEAPLRQKKVAVVADNTSKAKHNVKHTAAASAEKRSLSKSQGTTAVAAAAPVAKADTTSSLSRSTNGKVDDTVALEHLFFLDVFRIVLDKSQQALFPNYLLLSLLGTEIAKSGSAKLLSAKYARSVLLEAKSLLGQLPYLSYLLQCFSRLQDKSKDKRFAELSSNLQPLLVSQAAFVAQEVLSQSHGRDDIILALLQEPPEQALHSVRAFLRALAAHVYSNGGEDALDKVFGGSLSGAQYFMGRLDLLDDFHLPFVVMHYLLDDPLIAGLAMRRSNWLPSKLNGRELEHSSFLGPFFRPSSSSVAAQNQLFPENKQQEERENMVLGRSRLERLHSMQQTLCRCLIRSSEGRAKLMQWFKLVGECNKLKAKTMFDASLVSSSGFLLNCTYVVSSLFLEVCDSEKQNVLDPSFWLQFGAFGWEKETPLSSIETVVAYRARESKTGGRIPAPNVALLNELGYSALNLFHSAMAGCFAEGTALERDMQQLQEAIETLESTRGQWEMTNERAMGNLKLQELRAEFRRRETIWLARSCKRSFFFCVCLMFFFFKRSS